LLTQHKGVNYGSGDPGAQHLPWSHSCHAPEWGDLILQAATSGLATSSTPQQQQVHSQLLCYRQACLQSSLCVCHQLQSAVCQDAMCTAQALTWVESMLIGAGVSPHFAMQLFCFSQHVLQQW